MISDYYKKIPRRQNFRGFLFKDFIFNIRNGNELHRKDVGLQFWL